MQRLFRQPATTNRPSGEKATVPVPPGSALETAATTPLLVVSATPFPVAQANRSPAGEAATELLAPYAPGSVKRATSTQVASSQMRQGPSRVVAAMRLAVTATEL